MDRVQVPLETLERAISQNKVEAQIFKLPGDLRAIDAQGKADLRTKDGLVHMTVSRDLAVTLGPFSNEPVVATIELITTWSTNTGKERKVFRLLGIRPDAGEPGSK